jgi:hypothetical protein
LNGCKDRIVTKLRRRWAKPATVCGIVPRKGRSGGFPGTTNIQDILRARHSREHAGLFESDPMTVLQPGSTTPEPMKRPRPDIRHIASCHHCFRSKRSVSGLPAAVGPSGATLEGRQQMEEIDAVQVIHISPVDLRSDLKWMATEPDLG